MSSFMSLHSDFGFASRYSATKNKGSQTFNFNVVKFRESTKPQKKSNYMVGCQIDFLGNRDISICVYQTLDDN